MPLPADIAALVATGHGVVDVPTAEAAGVSPDRLERLVHRGELVRLRRGAFGDATPLEPWAAYRREVRAALLVCRDPAWATRWAGAAVHRLPHLGPPPATIHLVRDKTPGIHPSQHGRTRTLVAALPESARTEVDGLTVCTPERVAVDIARTADFRDALVVADAVLHRGLATPTTLAAEADVQADWPGGRRAARVVRHADGGADNPLETLGRLACIEYDLPVPLSNVWVGETFPEFRVDHLWPDHWLIGEGDGLGKYEDATVMEAEKERQWRLEQLGFAVVRYGWRLAYARRPALAARFADRLHRPGIPPVPARWWPADAR